jgi:hypothetical protein
LPRDKKKRLCPFQIEPSRVEFFTTLTLIEFIIVIMKHFYIFTLLSIIQHINAIAKIRDYNKVFFEHLTTYNEFAENYLTTDSDGKNTLTRNLFLGVADDECMNELHENPGFLGAQRHAGGNVLGKVKLLN